MRGGDVRLRDLCVGNHALQYDIPSGLEELKVKQATVEAALEQARECVAGVVIWLNPRRHAARNDTQEGAAVRRTRQATRNRLTKNSSQVWCTLRASQAVAALSCPGSATCPRIAHSGRGPTSRIAQACETGAGLVLMRYDVRLVGQLERLPCAERDAFC